MRLHLNKQPIRSVCLSIGMALLCNACMLNIPLPSQTRPDSGNQVESTQTIPCSPGIALEESMKENLSSGRDIGASGFGFSRATEALAIADPTGVVGAARTGFGLYQTGKVAADAKQNHKDCEDLPESDTDPDNE